MSKDYEFTMIVRVNDPEQLLAAALAHPDAEGMERDEFMKDGEIDVGMCLIMVLDPGTIEGGEILGSATTELDMAMVNYDGALDDLFDRSDWPPAGKGLK